MNLTEKIVVNHFEKHGWLVSLGNRKISGDPDFKIVNFETGERYYLEVKLNNHWFNSHQKKRINGLIKKGYKVMLAKYNDAKQMLTLYKIIDGLDLILHSKVRLSKSLKDFHVINCMKCGYEWKSKIDNPKMCPNCKNRNWKGDAMSYGRGKQMLVQFDDEEEEVIRYYMVKWRLSKYLTIKTIILKFDILNNRSKKKNG